MADKKNRDELERIMNQLADSILELSDQAILAEIRATGADPEQEAERTRLVLRQASKAFDDVNNRVSNLLACPCSSSRPSRQRNQQVWIYERK